MAGLTPTVEQKEQGPGDVSPGPVPFLTGSRERVLANAAGRHPTRVGLVVLALLVVGMLVLPKPAAEGPAGGLGWRASGPLLGDAVLVTAAVATWRAVAEESPDLAPGDRVSPVWAGRLGSARGVVLESFGDDGVLRLAQVTDHVQPWRDRLELVAVQQAAGIDGSLAAIALTHFPRASSARSNHFEYHLLTNPDGPAPEVFSLRDGRWTQTQPHADALPRIEHALDDPSSTEVFVQGGGEGSVLQLRPRELLPTR